jgi:predicted enzyme related to lactoylglutathione lyase
MLLYLEASQAEHRSETMSPRTRAHRGLCFGILLCAAAAAADATPPLLQLPPLQQPASSERHPGKVIWMELVTPDLAGAQRFYGGLFGWTFQEVPNVRDPYCVALGNGELVAGLVQPKAPHGGRHQPQWLPFISTRDVSRVRQQALAHGAKVLSPPRSYPGRGEQAVLSDPQGAVFGVLNSASGDPPDELADPGEWIWMSLLTNDPKRDAAFYQALFGYDVQPLPGSGGGEHLLLSTEGFARASANSLPHSARKEYPYWLGFVRVLDTAASVAKVKSLGGTVLTEPHAERHGGIVAVVADPAGTPFGLMEWAQEPAAESQEVPP